MSNRLSASVLIVATFCSVVFINFLPAFAQDNAATLLIDFKSPTKAVSPMFYGLMTEEINHSYDGGLYAELIQNRAFLDDSAHAAHWSLNNAEGAKAEMAVTDRFPLTDKLPKSLEVKVASADAQHRVTISNDGYWGFPIKPETSYKASFWIKGNAGFERKREDKEPPVLFRGSLQVALESVDGKKIYATAVTPKVTDHWQKFELTLTTDKDITPTTNARFTMTTENTGTFRMSLVSLFPPTYKNRANGDRIDISEKLAALNPRFLRFPGGNYVEGNTLWERFNWKETRGALESRPGHPGCWGYRSTDGLGLLEFMGWCEDLNMQPVLAVYAGYSLNGQSVEPGPLLQPFIDEALEEIEYLTGDAKTTYWGIKRAQDGHPAPFKLKYIEIGNEDWFDKTGNYDARFAMYFDAFKAKYPDLQLIATAGVKSRKPDVIDDHFYRNAGQFFKDIHHYDKTDRNGPKIFVGEWATREGKPTPNMIAALGDAAWMTGMERNSDIVIMHCYAPLLININTGGSQWTPDLIGYDALTSYGSPAYYAQLMFSNNIGNTIVPAELKAADGVFIPYSITRDDKTGQTFIKLVNPSDKPQSIQIKLDNIKLNPTGEVITMTGQSPTDTNTITEPDKIKPVTTELKDVTSDISYKIAPYTIAVIKVTGQ